MDMPCIIVVEDNRLLGLAVSAYLRSLGHAVVEAAGAAEAMACLAQVRVAAVLFDVHLNSQGVDLLRYMRSQPQLARIPVIALVSANYYTDTLDYLMPGDYVQLPFDLPLLDGILQRLLAGPACPEDIPYPTPQTGGESGLRS